MSTHDETARFLEYMLDKMKREPGKSPFEEMVIDYLEALTFDACLDRPASGEERVKS